MSDLKQWLNQAADRRAKEIGAHLHGSDLDTAGLSTVFTTLTEPPKDASKAEVDTWERTCDRCGKDCTDAPFFTGQTLRRLPGNKILLITYGVCSEHKE